MTYGNEKPDLIVTDFMMPEMDGVELIKVLLSKPKRGEICLDDEATCAIVQME